MKNKWYWLYSNICRDWCLYQLKDNHLTRMVYVNYAKIENEILPIEFNKIESQYLKEATKEEVIKEVVENFGWVKPDYTKYTEEEI